MAVTTVKAHSTIGTILEISENGTTWQKMCPIKSYPALGGAPEQIEVTDLEDETQTFVPGVQTMEAMEFSANYTLENYEAVKQKEKKKSALPHQAWQERSCWNGYMAGTALRIH